MLRFIGRLTEVVDQILHRTSRSGSAPPPGEPDRSRAEAPKPATPTPTPPAPSPPSSYDYDLPPSVVLEPKSPLEEEVLKVLGPLIDPGTGMGLVEMGLITRLHADDKGSVAVTFRPSSNVCPLAFQLGEDIVGAVASVDGVTEVSLSVENYVRAKELEEALNDR